MRVLLDKVVLEMATTIMAVDVGKWQSAGNQAKQDVQNLVMTVVNSFVLPAILLAIIVAMLFSLVGWLSARQQGDGEEIKKKGSQLLILIALFAIVAGYGSWAWGLL